jgi:beta-carotene 3-hydroxylase
MESSPIIKLLVVLSTVVAMEIVAFAVHKYVMHGWGWGWHRSHHEPRSGWFEKNDLYAIVFVALSLLFFTVAARAFPLLYWVGVGMALYGLLYLLVHDALVHRRFPFPAIARRGYLKRLVQAHRLHHAVRDRSGGVSFGFLYAPPVRQLKEALRRGRSDRR